MKGLSILFRKLMVNFLPLRFEYGSKILMLIKCQSFHMCFFLVVSLDVSTCPPGGGGCTHTYLRGGDVRRERLPLFHPNLRSFCFYKFKINDRFAFAKIAAIFSLFDNFCDFFRF